MANGSPTKPIDVGLVQIASPSDRIEEFIALARDKLDCVVDREQWDQMLWATHGFVTKGQNRKVHNLYFYAYGAKIPRKGTVDGAPMSLSIRDFAKAYIRYMHAASPAQFDTTKTRLAAVKAVEGALLRLGLEPHIKNVNVVVLNTAVEIAGSTGGKSKVYNLASCIQQLFQFCKDRGFLNASFEWRHSAVPPTDYDIGLHDEAKQWRENRLPSVTAFRALGHIFRNAETFKDRLFSAVSAIMTAVPIRAHEVLQLRLSCEYKATKSTSTGEVMEAYGIRVWPGKGYPPQVKFVPTVMVSTVKEAVQRLRALSEEVREIARWYELNPDRIYLPPHLELYRDQRWVPASIGHEILGLSDPVSFYAIVWGRDTIGWRGHGGRPRVDEVDLFDIERWMLKKLPPNFPKFNGRDDQPYSETLVLMRLNELHATRPTFGNMIGECTIGQLQDWLMGSSKPNVFDRWGLFEEDGSRIQVTSHAFRHWLNTVGQLGGLSELDIAKWSGRRPEQNRGYNHVTPEEIMSKIANAVGEGNLIGPMFAPAPSKLADLADEDDFRQVQIGSALITDAGFCVHDYSLLPCQNYGNCLNCSDNVFIKGDKEHRAKIARQLELAEEQAEDARKAVHAHLYGADRWLDHHLRGIDRMRRIIDLHDDRSIADGTLVNLENADQDTDVAMAIRDREANDGEKSSSIEDPGDLSLIASLTDFWED